MLQTVATGVLRQAGYESPHGADRPLTVSEQETYFSRCTHPPGSWTKSSTTPSGMTRNSRCGGICGGKDALCGFSIAQLTPPSQRSRGGIVSVLIQTTTTQLCSLGMASYRPICPFSQPSFTSGVRGRFAAAFRPRVNFRPTPARQSGRSPCGLRCGRGRTCQRGACPAHKRARRCPARRLRRARPSSGRWRAAIPAGLRRE